MNFGYLFLLPLQRLLLLLLLVPGWENTMAVKDGETQNCTPKMLNVTSETRRKWWFWLFFSCCRCYEFWLPFPIAAAEAFAAAAAGPRMGKHHGSEGRRNTEKPQNQRLLLLLLLLLLLVPGWENTMAVKDRETPKLHPENA